MIDPVQKLRLAIGRQGRVRLKRTRIRHRTARGVTKNQFKKAIKGSWGNRTVIAERLGILRNRVDQRLCDPDWKDVRQYYDQEHERVADIAEDTVLYAIRQKLDVATAARTALALLAKARYNNRNLGDESKIIHEGGDKPIHTVNENVINVESLELPLEVRKAILEAIEAKEQAKQSDTAATG
jgi:hypothetical protein